MSLTIEMLLGKSGFETGDEKQILMDAMKSARDDYISSALGYEGYSCDEDVGLDDVLIDGAKEPKRLITRAEMWNSEIDERLEREFQKVLRIYETNPQEGFVKALSSACDCSLDSDKRTSCYAIKKLLESFDGQMPRPVKGSGLAKGSCPIRFQRLTACPCGPNVSLPHYAFACIPRYRGLRLHRRAIDRARLFILPAEADKLPVS